MVKIFYPLNTNMGRKSLEHAPVENTGIEGRKTRLPLMTSVSSMRLPGNL